MQPRKCKYEGVLQYWVNYTEDGSLDVKQSEEQADEAEYEGFMGLGSEFDSFPTMGDDDKFDPAAQAEATARKVKKMKFDDQFPSIQETNLVDRVDKYKLACLSRKKQHKLAATRLLDDGSVGYEHLYFFSIFLISLFGLSFLRVPYPA